MVGIAYGARPADQEEFVAIAPHDLMARILLFTAVVEIGTAVTLLINPALVVALLLGTAADVTVQVVGRCFGIALLALVAAWWPDRARADSARSYFRGR